MSAIISEPYMSHMGLMVTPGGRSDCIHLPTAKLTLREYGAYNMLPLGFMNMKLNLASYLGCSTVTLLGKGELI